MSNGCQAAGHIDYIWRPYWLYSFNFCYQSSFQIYIQLNKFDYVLSVLQIGSYLLRDSSDSKFLYSISVKTSRGTTSIRVAPSPGCSSCANCLTTATSSWAVPTNCDDTAASPYFISDALYRPRTPPSPVTPSYLNVKSSSQFRTSYPTRRMMRLDCDPSQESQMPHFPDVLSLINYCVRLGNSLSYLLRGLQFVNICVNLRVLVIHRSMVK